MIIQLAKIIVQVLLNFKLQNAMKVFLEKKKKNDKQINSVIFVFYLRLSIAQVE